MFKRVFCIVIDSVGCGTAPLSYEYDDDGAKILMLYPEGSKIQ